MRWFYRDPLEAAWMAKHFGMRFGKRGYAECPWPNGMWHDLGLHEFTEESADGLYDVEGKPLFYIHSDSLHMLEPQTGDVIQNTSSQFAYYGLKTIVTHETEDKYCYEASALYGSFTLTDNDCIIQRNGKPFHWPEQEA